MKKTFLLVLVLSIMLPVLQAQYSLKYILQKDGKVVETKTYNLSTGELEYPVEVPFTEYSLESTSCEWKELEYESGGYRSEIVIINSDEELQNYIVCTDESYPEIDFDKYTLLFTHGMSTQGIKNITKQLIKTEQDKYNLDVNITQNMTMKPEKWEVAIIVSKLPESSVVTLNVETIK
jgi:hypothetical protein